MLTELCQELRNWFTLTRRSGTFEISGGSLTADFLAEGQYFRIIGSIFNDGVWKFGEDELDDETFDGEVWALGIPKAVIALSEEINDWEAKYGGVDSQAMSPFQSESFGGYSYSKGGSGNSQNGGTDASWKSVFASKLNRWRKI